MTTLSMESGAVHSAPNVRVSLIEPASFTAIFEYVEVLYNRARLHSALSHTTPLQIEKQYQQARNAP